MQQKDFRIVQCRMVKMTPAEASGYLLIHKGSSKEDATNLTVSALSSQGEIALVASCTRVMEVVVHLAESPD